MTGLPRIIADDQPGRWGAALDRFFDRFVRPRLFGRSAYRVCGVSGFVAAVALAQGLAAWRGLSHLVVALLAIAAAATFFAVARVTLIHVDEIAAALDQVAAGDATTLHLGCTRLGLQISAGAVATEAGRLRHYALSRRAPALSTEAAVALARLILRLRHRSAAGELVEGRQSIYHLLVPEP